MTKHNGLRTGKGSATVADMRVMTLRWLFCLALWVPLSATAGQAWVLVDTATSTVSVQRDKHTLLRLRNASLGRGGVAPLHLNGDGSTPLGSFHIIGINYNSRYGLFFALDYPTDAQAALGYLQGVINVSVLHQIEQARATGQLPPQDTPLGGNIGIHGLGTGSLWVHRRFNWTNGCIALTNGQIEKLAPWLEIGTRVVIQ